MATHYTITADPRGTTGLGDALYTTDLGLNSYGWDNTTIYIGRTPTNPGEYYWDRPMMNFSLSIPNVNCRVKSLELKIASGVNWDVKKLTSLYDNTGGSAGAETVWNAIGNSNTTYASNQSDGAYRDLGANAVSQLENNWMSSNGFCLGLIETDENAAGTVTEESLRVKFYYPPTESEEWVINETYPLGSTGKGLGTVTAAGDVNVQNGGELILWGNTNLVIPTGKKLIVDYGGKVTIKIGEGAKITKKY